MSEKFTAAIAFTTVPELLKGAGRLAELAAQHPEDAPVLAACITVMLGEVLEQGTLTELSHSALHEAEGNPKNIKITASARLREQSVRVRMVRLPEILSKGAFRLDKDSPHVKALHDLINHRNLLMHVNEPSQIVSKDQDRVTEFRFEPDGGTRNSTAATNSDGKMVISDEDGNLIFERDIKLYKSPWTTITLEQAIIYRRAVELYAQEILTLDDSFEPGILVRPAR